MFYLKYFTYLTFFLFISNSAYGKVTGYLDKMWVEKGKVWIRGWACDTKVKKSIPVHVYVGKKNISVQYANKYNEYAVTRRCKTGMRAHRYKFPLPRTISQYAGSKLSIYGISQTKGKNNPLVRSGKLTIPKVPSTIRPIKPTPPTPIKIPSTATDKCIIKGRDLINPNKDKNKSCTLKLSPNTVHKEVLHFYGNQASNSTLDCQGGTIKGVNRVAMKFISKWDGKKKDYTERPTNITIKNCKFQGVIALQSVNYDRKREQSLNNPHFTQWLRDRSPKNITFDNISMHLSNWPHTFMYVQGGATGVIVKNSKFTGDSSDAIIYLSHESGYNKILNSTFNVRRTRKREIIAIDGSSNNSIIGNTFKDLSRGGILLYRNCGERGIARHQTPSFNVIKRNTFHFSNINDKGAVVLSSRNGNRRYCKDDRNGHYGSAKDDKDRASRNVISDNLFIGRSPRYAINNYSKEVNYIEDNRHKGTRYDRSSNNLADERGGGGSK